MRIGKERKDVHVAESTVRQYVRERKRAMGLRTSPEVYIPQQYAWGDEAQVDWYEAEADLDGERQTVQVTFGRLRARPAHCNLHCVDRRPLALAVLRVLLQNYLDTHGGVGVANNVGMKVWQLDWRTSEVTFGSNAE